MKRTGISDMPLHYGHPPEKLFKHMVDLTSAIIEIINSWYGPSTIIKRLSDPIWFQSLSLVTGFDWNSSGTTTATLYALKEVLKHSNTGILMAGGKGNDMTGTKMEIERSVSDRVLSDHEGIELINFSRKIARADSNLLQDGYDLYIHSMLFRNHKDWSIIQQGIDRNERMARRYQWHSSSADHILDDGRSGIFSIVRKDSVLDLTTSKSRENRNGMIETVRDPLILRTVNNVKKNGQFKLDYFQEDLKFTSYDLPVNWEKLRQIYEYQPSTFDELFMMKGVGKSAIRALSYISEVIMGKPPSYSDPLRYTFALGGKDGIPKPVNYEDYDVSIEFFSEILKSVDIPETKKRESLEKLSRMSIQLAPH
jgi:hypothetical protein